MDFSKALFPVVSNRKGEGQITLDDFKVLAPKKEVKKADIIWKNNKWTINKSFLEGNTTVSGFTGIILEGKAYLLKSTTEETFENTIFLKGENPTPTFSSDSLFFILQTTGVNVENDVYLNFQSNTDGWDVYEISNVESVNPVIEEIQVKEGPHDPNIVIPTQEQTEAYAQVGVEEASPIAYNYQEGSLEQLL